MTPGPVSRSRTRGVGRRERAAALALVLGVASGCGAASNADRHALYGALQVEEARVAAAEHAALEGECEARPAACDDACDASARASELAGRIGERDAHVRAEHAARTCAWCRAQAACEPLPSASAATARSEDAP